MGVDALGYTLGLLTMGVTMVAVKNKNMLITIGAAALWACLLAYILANTVAGTNWQTLFILAACVFMMAIPLLSFFSRGRTESVTRVGVGEGEVIAQTTTKEGVTGKTLMGKTEEEYRASVRRALHPRRRR